MKSSRIAWTLWAVVPVLALTFHYGPGQRSFREAKAARVLERSDALRAEAVAMQDAAYTAHVDAVAARAAARGQDDPLLKEAARLATEREQAAYAEAGLAWRELADALGEASSLLEGSDASVLQPVRLARARAVVRSGDIETGASELEQILRDADPDSSIAFDAREELATALYYGARLMRLAGDPKLPWREVAASARQNFRYLAERAKHDADAGASAFDLERNGELVLNLEQSGADDLLAKAGPRDSPGGSGVCVGNLAGRKGKGKGKGRGDGNGDQSNNGASRVGEIGHGW